MDHVAVPVRCGGARWGAVVACFLACLMAAPALAEPTPAQNAAAFAAGVAITKQSYHWDSVSDGIPLVATTPRTPLPVSTLTTISWNPSRSQFYQRKTIDSVDVECTLVATFTSPFSTWTAPRGTVTQLTFSQSGATGFIMPWVTAGESLRDYLRTTYFTGAIVPSPLEAQHRIQQSVGLPIDDKATKGLATFWVPLANLARPAYSADISSQLPPLATYGDGSYEALAAGAPAGFSYLDDSDPTKTFGTLPEFVEWNGAQTTYPWTAMGYTYNWNALQASGANPAFGYDPLAPTSPIGVSEFVVSAGSKIVNEGFVTNAQLGFWAADIWPVPEIGPNGVQSVIALVAGVLGLLERRRWPEKPA